MYAFESRIPAVLLPQFSRRGKPTSQVSDPGWDKRHCPHGTLKPSGADRGSIAWIQSRNKWWELLLPSRLLSLSVSEWSPNDAMSSSRPPSPDVRPRFWLRPCRMEHEWKIPQPGFFRHFGVQFHPGGQGSRLQKYQDEGRRAAQTLRNRRVGQARASEHQSILGGVGEREGR